ncbi:MAG TPA: LptF/LptG family permease [Verrucomicrobiales bacterium]|jgi:lipopolysaccharide export system permease protein|nr:LptF/LptG family permease [Verrucomicrobiales bacterium]
MRIFDRYIARQILVSTVMAVVMLSVVLVLGQIFKKLLDGLVAGILPPSAVFKFMGYAFPMSLCYTIPWGILTAVLLTFGRLSADNELISMRMAGMSLRRICLPVFVVAGGLSALCFWINTTVAPFAYTETSRMTRQALIRDPRILFQPDKTVDQLPGHLIYVEDRQGDELRNVQIIQLQDDGDKGKRGRPSRMIFAKEGRLNTEGMEQRQSIEFGATNNTYFIRDEVPPLTPDELSKMPREAIEKHDALMTEQSKGAPHIFDFGTALSEIPIGMKSLFDKSAAVRVDGLTMGEIRNGMKDSGALQRANPGVKVPSPTEIRTEWHRRISFSLACFVLALVGIPFGITAQRRETSSGFVLSLVVGISYFSLIMLGSIWSSKPNYYPHLWVWLPNVVFGILGVVMFLRLQRK